MLVSFFLFAFFFRDACFVFFFSALQVICHARKLTASLCFACSGFVEVPAQPCAAALWPLAGKLSKRGSLGTGIQLAL